MARLYRLSKLKHRKALDGTGAYLAGGRWNERFVAAIYASESEALARLECLAGVRRDRIGKRLLHVIEVADELILDVAAAGLAVPAGWDGFPPWPAEAQAMGTQFLRAAKALALWVPSVHSTSERNVLINPAHPDLSRVAVSEPKVIGYDQRLVVKRVILGRRTPRPRRR